MEALERIKGIFQIDMYYTKNYNWGKSGWGDEEIV